MNGEDLAIKTIISLIIREMYEDDEQRIDQFFKEYTHVLRGTLKVSLPEDLPAFKQIIDRAIETEEDLRHMTLGRRNP